MNCAGIDVSKGKSMIAVIRPFGKLVIPPFEVGTPMPSYASYQDLWEN